MISGLVSGLAKTISGGGASSETPAFALDDISGEPLLPQPAIGDPARLYIAVRSESALAVPEGAVATAPSAQLTQPEHRSSPLKPTSRRPDHDYPPQAPLHSRLA